MMYDFGGGRTDPGSFPIEELVDAAKEAIPAVGTDFVNYPGDLGHQGLREILAARESEREGVEVSPEHISLTNGSFQAVTLVAEALMDKPGDVIITEELTYSGTIGAYKRMGAQLVGVPLDNEGMQIGALDETLMDLNRRGISPRFIYTLATYQNPTGSVMPARRRNLLLEVAQKHEVIVVEDNCYGDVHFDGDKQPALYALNDSPDVIYLCSLSKIFGPGVRLGYFYARPPMLERILDRRYDGGASLLSSAICAAYFKGRLWDHVKSRNEILRRKRDAVLSALETHGADLCTWSRPVGGLFIWIGFPADVDRRKLADLLAEAGVNCAMGAQFHVHGEDIPFLRLAFGYIDQTRIEGGIEAIVKCIRSARASRPVSEEMAPAAG